MKTESIMTDTRTLVNNLTWVDLLKGAAIIAVFFDNWIAYMELDPNPAVLYSVVSLFKLAVGPVVQVFFILSGFGLTKAYLDTKANWIWPRWAWRRFTKIVVPYAIVVVFTFMLGTLGSHLYTSVDIQFSWSSFFAYLTFTRNFFPASWDWNRPLWFMPLIIGLYISFPVLIKVLEKWGQWVLLLLSAVITFGTITIAVSTGVHGGHQADLFSFWMIQFSLGIVLAHARHWHPQKLNNLIGFRAFFLGMGLFAFSWGLRTYLPAGRAYNDVFSSVGIFLILLNLCWIGWTRSPAIGKVLNSLSARSYLMYLVHYPIMAFLIGPPLRVSINAIIVVALGGIYFAGIFFLCVFVSQPMDKLTSWLYHRYRSA